MTPRHELPGIVDAVIEVAIPLRELTEPVDVSGALEHGETARDTDGRTGHRVTELVGGLLVLVEVLDSFRQSPGARETDLPGGRHVDPVPSIADLPQQQLAPPAILRPTPSRHEAPVTGGSLHEDLAEEPLVPQRLRHAQGLLQHRLGSQTLVSDDAQGPCRRQQPATSCARLLTAGGKAPLDHQQSILLIGAPHRLHRQAAAGSSDRLQITQTLGENTGPLQVDEGLLRPAQAVRGPRPFHEQSGPGRGFPLTRELEGIVEVPERVLERTGLQSLVPSQGQEPYRLGFVGRRTRLVEVVCERRGVLLDPRPVGALEGLRDPQMEALASRHRESLEQRLPDRS